MLTLEGEHSVSASVVRAVELLYKSIAENSAQINERLSDAGVDPRQIQALVFTAAKYYEALNKLADE